MFVCVCDPVSERDVGPTRHTAEARLCAVAVALACEALHLKDVRVELRVQ